MSTDRVLVAFGSKHGATADIATWIGDGLREQGLPVDVRKASDVDDVEPYGAVVLGGSVYMGRWDATARHFARRHQRALRARPVWLFSSGPLDDSADHGEVTLAPAAARATRRVGAREHVTFGGRLAPDATGPMMRAMAKEHAGDWRNPDRVRAWAHRIAAELGAQAGRAHGPTLGPPLSR
jgi:menaquinone-dependent protoporphyrinogen oxidase